MSCSALLSITVLKSYVILRITAKENRIKVKLYATSLRLGEAICTASGTVSGG